MSALAGFLILFLMINVSTKIIQSVENSKGSLSVSDDPLKNFDQSLKTCFRKPSLTNEKRIAKSGLPTLFISPDHSKEFSVKYRFRSHYKNPYWTFEDLIPIRPCLIIHHNSSKLLHNLNTGKEVSTGIIGYISDRPKTYTKFEKVSAGITSEFETDDFKTSHHRRNKAADKFCDFYELLYQNRKVSVLFHAFTRDDYARKDISTMLECVKRRYEALKRPIRGYYWVLELKRNRKMITGYHIHYHLVVAIDRVTWRKIPKKMKFEDLWGQRTSVGFVKVGVRSYLKKELVKSNAKILRKRMYGISQKLK